MRCISRCLSQSKDVKDDIQIHYKTNTRLVYDSAEFPSCMYEVFTVMVRVRVRSLFLTMQLWFSMEYLERVGMSICLIRFKPRSPYSQQEPFFSPSPYLPPPPRPTLLLLLPLLFFLLLLPSVTVLSYGSAAAGVDTCLFACYGLAWNTSRGSLSMLDLVVRLVFGLGVMWEEFILTTEACRDIWTQVLMAATNCCATELPR